MATYRGWLDTRNAALLTVSQNWVNLMTGAPAEYGVLPADVTTLTGLVTAYDAALTASTTPESRNQISVAQKDIAKLRLIAEMRYLYKKINAALLPADKRLELGLPIIDREPSPLNPPGSRPVLTMMATQNRSVRCRAADETTPTRRAKPFGVQGLHIFSFCGNTPPENLEDWHFEGQCTRSEFTIIFGAAAAAGSKVWIAARWYNPRGQTGPASDPITTYVGGGISQAA